MLKNELENVLELDSQTTDLKFNNDCAKMLLNVLYKDYFSFNYEKEDRELRKKNLLKIDFEMKTIILHIEIIMDYLYKQNILINEIIKKNNEIIYNHKKNNNDVAFGK